MRVFVRFKGSTNFFWQRQTVIDVTVLCKKTSTVTRGSHTYSGYSFFATIAHFQSYSKT